MQPCGQSATMWTKFNPDHMVASPILRVQPDHMVASPIEGWLYALRID